MTRLIKIIRKQLNNYPFSLDLDIACAIFECRRDVLIAASIRVSALSRETTPIARCTDCDGDKKDTDKQDFFQCEFAARFDSRLLAVELRVATLYHASLKS